MEPRKFTSHARFVHGILCVLGERQERPQKAVSAERFGMEEKMKEKWNEFQTSLEEMTLMKKREYFLTVTVCLLAGLVIGMLISPRKFMMIGNNNGNNNGNDERNYDETEE